MSYPPGTEYLGIIEAVRYLGLLGAEPTGGQTVGGTHSSTSYHYRGLAVDFGINTQGGGTALMDAIYAALLPYAQAPNQVIVELFWASNGWKDGRSIGAVSGHNDHVHVAVYPGVDLLEVVSGNPLAAGGTPLPPGAGAGWENVYDTVTLRPDARRIEGQSDFWSFDNPIYLDLPGRLILNGYPFSVGEAPEAVTFIDGFPQTSVSVGQDMIATNTSISGDIYRSCTLGVFNFDIASALSTIASFSFLYTSDGSDWDLSTPPSVVGDLTVVPPQSLTFQAGSGRADRTYAVPDLVLRYETSPVPLLVTQQNESGHIDYSSGTGVPDDGEILLSDEQRAGSQRLTVRGSAINSSTSGLYFTPRPPQGTGVEISRLPPLHPSWPVASAAEAYPAPPWSQPSATVPLSALVNGQTLVLTAIDADTAAHVMTIPSAPYYTDFDAGSEFWYSMAPPLVQMTVFIGRRFGGCGPRPVALGVPVVEAAGSQASFESRIDGGSRWVTAV